MGVLVAPGGVIGIPNRGLSGYLAIHHNARVVPIIGITSTEMPGMPVQSLTRITFNPDVMGGKPCIRGLRVTVGTVVGLLAAGRTIEAILQAYPYLEREDIYEALSYAAWRADEIDVPLASA